MLTDNDELHTEATRIAHNIVEWTKERGMSIRDLAECTGVPYTYLSQAEKGFVSEKITMQDLDAICRLFGKQLHEIVIMTE